MRNPQRQKTRTAARALPRALAAAAALAALAGLLWAADTAEAQVQHTCQGYLPLTPVGATGLNPDGCPYFGVPTAPTAQPGDSVMLQVNNGGGISNWVEWWQIPLDGGLPSVSMQCTPDTLQFGPFPLSNDVLYVAVFYSENCVNWPRGMAPLKVVPIFVGTEHDERLWEIIRDELPPEVVFPPGRECEDLPAITSLDYDQLCLGRNPSPSRPCENEGDIGECQDNCFGAALVGPDNHLWIIVCSGRGILYACIGQGGSGNGSEWATEICAGKDRDYLGIWESACNRDTGGDQPGAWDCQVFRGPGIIIPNQTLCGSNKLCDHDLLAMPSTTPETLPNETPL